MLGYPRPSLIRPSWQPLLLLLHEPEANSWPEPAVFLHERHRQPPHQLGDKPTRAIAPLSGQIRDRHRLRGSGTFVHPDQSTLYLHGQATRIPPVRCSRFGWCPRDAIAQGDSLAPLRLRSPTWSSTARPRCACHPSPSRAAARSQKDLPAGAPESTFPRRDHRWFRPSARAHRSHPSP